MIEQVCEVSGLGTPTSVVRRTGGALSAVYEVARFRQAEESLTLYRIYHTLELWD